MLAERLLMFLICVGSIALTLFAVNIINTIQAKNKKRMDDNNHGK